MLTRDRPASRGMSGTASVSCWSCTEQQKLTAYIDEYKVFCSCTYLVLV